MKESRSLGCCCFTRKLFFIKAMAVREILHRNRKDVCRGDGSPVSPSFCELQCFTAPRVHEEESRKACRTVLGSDMPSCILTRSYLIASECWGVFGIICFYLYEGRLSFCIPSGCKWAHFVVAWNVKVTVRFEQQLNTIIYIIGQLIVFFEANNYLVYKMSENNESHL